MRFGNIRLDSFRCLCRNCHDKRHKEEVLMRSFLIKYNTEELKQIRRALDIDTYWYSVEDAMNIVASFNLTGDELLKYMQEAIKKRRS